MSHQPEVQQAGEPTAPALHRLAEKIGAQEALEPVADKVAGVVRKAVSNPKVKDALSGTWLGHALHPLLTDIPIGAWTSATFLDLAGGSDSEEAADRLLAAGILTALPTVASGYSDWGDTLGSTRRIGLVHAAANATALTLYSASWLARRRGNRGKGVALSLVAGGALGAGGFLGGHLSYSKGIGVDQTAFDDEIAEWTAVVAESDLAAGRPAKGEAGGVDVMVVKREGRIHALADRCTHLGGPLHQGEIEDGCVVCPWHDSRFRLEDGSVAQGPARSPQPAYDVRVRDGQVEVRSPAGG